MRVRSEVTEMKKEKLDNGKMKMETSDAAGEVIKVKKS